MNTTKKMTHKDYFAALLEMPEVQNYPGMTEFIEGRITALEKKASAPKKESEADKVKSGIKADVLAFLSANEGKKFTVTQMMKQVPNLPADISNQRLTSLVTQMVRENEVERVVEKRVSYFTIAVAD
jgi:hypothetical protein